jgi:hypothetical protein
VASAALDMATHDVHCERDDEVIDAFAPLQEFHDGQGLWKWFVPTASAILSLAARIEGKGVPSNQALA